MENEFDAPENGVKQLREALERKDEQNKKLEAELVSVNGNYWLSESLQGEFWGQPACVQLKQESLEITALVKG